MAGCDPSQHRQVPHGPAGGTVLERRRPARRLRDSHRRSRHQHQTLLRDAGCPCASAFLQSPAAGLEIWEKTDHGASGEIHSIAGQRRQVESHRVRAACRRIPHCIHGHEDESSCQTGFESDLCARTPANPTDEKVTARFTDRFGCARTVIFIFLLRMVETVSTADTCVVGHLPRRTDKTACQTVPILFAKNGQS